MVAGPGEVGHVGLRTRAPRTRNGEPISPRGLLQRMRHLQQNGWLCLRRWKSASRCPRRAWPRATTIDPLMHCFGWALRSTGPSLVPKWCGKEAVRGLRCVFCLSLCPGRKRFHSDSRRAFAFMDHIIFGLMGVTTSTARSLPLIDIVVKPAKTVALPPRHIPTVEGGQVSTSESRKREGVTDAGVAAGAEKNVVERTMGAVRDGGADCLARCQSAMCRTSNWPPYLPINPPDIENQLLPRARHGHRFTRRSMSDARQRSDVNSVARPLTRSHRRTTFSRGGILERLADAEDPTNRHKRACQQGRKGWVGLPSAEARRTRASFESRDGTFPEAPADLTCSFERPSKRRDCLNQELLPTFSEGACGRIATHERFPKEEMAGIVPES